MADVSGKFYSATKVRTGVSPSSPGVEVGETLPPVNPPGGGLNSVGLTMPTAFAVANSPLTSNGTLEVTGAGTTAQYIRGDGSLASFPSLTGYVPYTGATADVDLGTHDLTAERGTFQNNGSSDTLTVNHTSGSGYGIIVTKGGNNEALYVSKTSGSGNAMTVIGGRTSLVDLALSTVTNTAGDFLTISGGVVHKRTAAEVRTDIGAGTVTSVAALTLGTSGTDLSSTVANGTTTPVITLNVPTASATNRGALSSADWTTFNSKQQALNGTGFVKASGTTISYDNTSYLPLTGGTITGNLTVNGVYNVPASSYFISGSNGFRFNSSGDAFNNFIIYDNGNTLTRGEATFSNLAGSGTRMVVANSSGLLSTQAIPLGTVTSVTASSPLASSGGTTPNITIQQATGSQNGFLSSTDWTTFNSKQNALTNPVTGTGTTNYLPKFTGTSTIGNSLIFDNGTNVGIGTNNPTIFGGGLEVSRAGQAGVRVSSTGSGGGGIEIGNANGTGGFIQTCQTGGIITFITDNASTTAMTIFSNGNTFIGSSPSNAGFKLDVNGTARFSGSGSTNLSVERTGSNGVFIGLKDASGNTVFLGGNNGDFLVQTPSGGFSNKLTITNAGEASFSSSVTASSIIRSGGTSSQYLMADGSVSTLTNPVTGTGTAGQVAYWSSGSAITGESNLFWDATNDRLGIGTASPLGSLEVRAANRAVSNDGILQVNSNNSQAIDLGGSISFGGVWTGTSVTEWAQISGRKESATSGVFAGYLSFATRPSGGANTERMRITSGGSVLIGTTDNNGYKLRVNGDLWVDGIYRVPVSSYFICGSAGYRFNSSDDAFNNFVILNNGNTTTRGSSTASSFFESSDATIKTLVEDDYQAKGIDSVVAKLYIKNGKQELGYFAQDLQNILPSAVNKGSDGLLNLSYREVHTAKIASLENRIKELESQLKNN